MTTDPDEARSFASPPCYAHELRPEALDDVNDSETAGAELDVRRWRRETREALVAARCAIPKADRKKLSDEVASVLDELIAPGPGRIVSVYWPIKGELDLRDWMLAVHGKGARVALPVVDEEAQPLIFREWFPGCKLVRGVWNIPVPADTERVIPDVVISPLVGFDPDGYRLGNGGGYFDRTLAVLPAETLKIGVGHPAGALSTIHPQPHDIPMDVIVTGRNPIVKRKK